MYILVVPIIEVNMKDQELFKKNHLLFYLYPPKNLLKEMKIFENFQNGHTNDTNT